MNLADSEFYKESRKSLRKALAAAQPAPEHDRVEQSPCGRFSLQVTHFWLGEYRCGVGELCGPNGPMATIESNLGFSHTWVPRHPSGCSYLVTHEDYQGISVIELGRGTRVDYLPPEAEQGQGFCSLERYPSADGSLLALYGCVWAGPSEVLVVDFRRPLEPPYPLLWRGRGEKVLGFREDGGLVFIDYEDVFDGDDHVGERKITYLLTPEFETSVLEVGPTKD